MDTMSSSHDLRNAPTLQTLPLDIIELIALQFAATDNEPRTHTLLQLRSTCRAIEEYTRRVWTKVYFNRRCLWLEPTKLCVLGYVSTISEFATRVTEVHVQCVDDSRLKGFSDAGALPGRSLTRFRELSLRRIFENLANVTTIRFCGSLTESIERESSEHFSLVDFSETFRIVLTAAQDCSLQLEEIWMSQQEQAHFGIGDCRVVARLREYFSGIKGLGLGILLQQGLAYNPIGDAVFSRYLVAGLSSCTALTKLELSFAMGDAVFALLASSVVFPLLKHLHFEYLGCELGTLAHFLRHHSRTLRVCDFTGTWILDDNASVITRFALFLMELRDHFSLSELILCTTTVDGQVVEFPGSCYTKYEEKAVDEGYLEIGFDPKTLEIHNGDMRRGITDALDFLVW